MDTLGSITFVVAVASGLAVLLVGTHLVRRRSTASPGRVDAQRFDGERAYVTRGGVWIGEAHAAWPMAELAVDSTSARLRSRPVGLFEDVALGRGDVGAVVVQRGALGNGISFRHAPEHVRDVVFWPTDAGEVLDALRDRGWPVDAPA